MTLAAESPDLVLRAIAAYGLSGGPPLPDGAFTDSEFAGLLAQCERHGLLGHLGVAARGGHLRLQAGQRDELELCLQSWLAHSLRLERLLIDALECLADAGVETRVLKGVALAHSVYPEPSWRVFRDVDVLVPAHDFSTAVRALENGVAVVREEPEIRAGFDARFGKEALLRTGQGLEFDLHRTFVEGALGLTVHLTDLFAPPDPFDLAGHQVATLPPPQQLLHAAYTVMLGDWPPRLSAMRDLAQILLVLDPDPAEVLELARRWRARLVLSRALAGAWACLTPERRSPLVDWAQSYHPGRLERVLLASHVGPARAFTRHAAALLVAPGISARFAYLRAIAWPDQTYLERRGFTRRGFAGRALARLRR